MLAERQQGVLCPLVEKTQYKQNSNSEEGH